MNQQETPVAWIQFHEDPKLKPVVSIGAKPPPLWPDAKPLVYAAPQAPAAQPLTDWQVSDLWIRRPSFHDGDLMLQLYDFARSVERHHGIGIAPSAQGEQTGEQAP